MASSQLKTYEPKWRAPIKVPLPKKTANDRKPCTQDRFVSTSDYSYFISSSKVTASNMLTGNTIFLSIK